MKFLLLFCVIAALLRVPDNLSMQGVSSGIPKGQFPLLIPTKSNVITYFPINLLGHVADFDGCLTGDTSLI